MDGAGEQQCCWEECMKDAHKKIAVIAALILSGVAAN